MYRLATSLHEIAICFSRTYLPARVRIRLLSAFYLLRIKGRFLRGRAERVTFLGYALSASSFVNLITIIREVFLFGDYYFKANTVSPRIIDCGGNVGISTLHFKWMYPEARVTVFEPSPSNLGYLRRNIEDNGLKNVEIVEGAVSDKEGTITFWENMSRPGSSTSVESVHEVKSKKKTDAFVHYDVKAVKLSSYIDSRVDLLKMDIEGAEGMVIAELAASGALAKIDNIIMEYHDNKANVSNNLPKLLTTLNEHGLNTLIFENELGPSSEELIRREATHFLMRASRII